MKDMLDILKRGSLSIVFLAKETVSDNSFFFYPKRLSLSIVFLAKETVSFKAKERFRETKRC